MGRNGLRWDETTSGRHFFSVCSCTALAPKWLDFDLAVLYDVHLGDVSPDALLLFSVFFRRPLFGIWHIAPLLILLSTSNDHDRDSRVLVYHRRPTVSFAMHIPHLVHTPVPEVPDPTIVRWRSCKEIRTFC